MPAPVSPSMRYSALRSGYLPGQQMEVDLFAIDGAALGPCRLIIGESPGSGFAGQVYRAELRSSSHLQDSPTTRAAVKVLRPRSAWKLFLRDSLFRLSFQTSFAPRLRAPALRCGLLWQSILRAAAGGDAVAQPLGYYWDADLGSYVEVHEWIESRPTRYETDDLLVARWLGRCTEPPSTEMARKKAFMDSLADLCRQIGALGLARQYEWYTLISQSNVLARLCAVQPANGEEPPMCFTAVDCRPGLAFPFFLPFTPVHLKFIIEGLRHGLLAHFDEVDLTRLDAYLAAHPSLAAQVAPWVTCLRHENALYRASLPDLWHTRLRILSAGTWRAKLRAAALQDWLHTRQIAPQAAAWLQTHPLIFVALYLLSALPLIGSLLLRITANPPFRAHLAGLAVDSLYRRAWLEQARARDIAEWTYASIITPRGALRLARSPAAYLLEKICCAWLPPSLHRLIANPEARGQVLNDVLIQPLRMLTSHSARVEWLEGIVRSERERGLIRPARAAILIDQIHEPRFQGFIRDIGIIAGLDILSRLVYLGLGVYALTTGDFLPLGIAALSPIPPSGPLRAAYVLIQLGIDLVGGKHMHPNRRRLALARLGALALAPWRGVGNLFPILEISTYYPRLALLLADFYTARAVRSIPIIGGQGKLLEYWTFQACYNLPVGFKKILTGIG